MAEEEIGIKYMDIKEFREEGYLQEANRRFFHPLGLALETYKDRDGKESIAGIWDYRDDPEGIIFNIAKANKQRQQKFLKCYQNVQEEMEQKKKTRLQRFGFFIESILPFSRRS
jgi:hypothetical protein